MQFLFAVVVHTFDAVGSDDFAYFGVGRPQNIPDAFGNGKGVGRNDKVCPDNFVRFAFVLLFHHSFQQYVVQRFHLDYFAQQIGHKHRYRNVKQVGKTPRTFHHKHQRREGSPCCRPHKGSHAKHHYRAVQCGLHTHCHKQFGAKRTEQRTY